MASEKTLAAGSSDSLAAALPLFFALAAASLAFFALAAAAFLALAFFSASFFFFFSSGVPPNLHRNTCHPAAAAGTLHRECSCRPHPKNILNFISLAPDLPVLARLSASAVLVASSASRCSSTVSTPARNQRDGMSVG